MNNADEFEEALATFIEGYAVSMNDFLTALGMLLVKMSLGPALKETDFINHFCLVLKMIEKELKKKIGMPTDACELPEKNELE
jgi:hypothetical protein